jgi:hypothetical protein
MYLHIRQFLRTFEAIAHYCGKNSELIPLTFMLGFFVQLVVTRWWDIFMNIGWIEKFCLTVNQSICFSPALPYLLPAISMAMMNDVALCVAVWYGTWSCFRQWSFETSVSRFGDDSPLSTRSLPAACHSSIQ